MTEAARALSAGILAALGCTNVEIHVLACRPKNAEGELHGLYTLEADGSARIEVWMRTSAKKKVVRFKTFLRTLVHEICHHLDFTLLRLADTYHTEGFFRRESSLVRQLLSETSKARPTLSTPAPPTPPPKREKKQPAQLTLFD